MSSLRTSSNSVFADPLRRRPLIPGAHLRIDMLIWGVALFCVMRFAGSAATGFHVPPESGTTPVTWRDLAELREHDVWTLVYAGVGLFALTLMAFRMHYRVHRCEMLLRWSGIDEARLLDGPLPDEPQPDVEAQPDATS